MSWRNRYGARHLRVIRAFTAIKAHLGMELAPSRGGAFTAFRIWPDQEPVRVHVREWQVVQHDLFAIQASIEDLQRFLALQPGPLATLAAMHYLRTCLGQRSPIPQSNPRHSFNKSLSRSCITANGCTLVCGAVHRCNCTRYGMDNKCVQMGLHWLRETLPHRPGDQLQLTLRLWHLGPLEPLGGWRTRDTMSSVRSFDCRPTSHACNNGVPCFTLQKFNSVQPVWVLHMLSLSTDIWVTLGLCCFCIGPPR